LCDKIFFGKCKLFDTIFGNDFLIYLQEWIKIGGENNFDFRTERFYKELMRRAKIKNRCVNFHRNDVRFYRGNIITPNLYKKSFKNHLKAYWKELVPVSLLLSFIVFKHFPTRR